MLYFDTGVLLNLYLPEPRAAEAVVLALEFGATGFCSFDLRQSRMPAAMGLTVIS